MVWPFLWHCAELTQTEAALDYYKQIIGIKFNTHLSNLEVDFSCPSCTWLSRGIKTSTHPFPAHTHYPNTLKSRQWTCSISEGTQQLDPENTQKKESVSLEDTWHPEGTIDLKAFQSFQQKQVGLPQERIDSHLGPVFWVQLRRKYT